MRVAFRVDASIFIGTGHVIRCLALAEALRERGAECLFISRLHLGHLTEFIYRRGFPVHELPAPKQAICEETETKYAPWLGVSVNQDVAETVKALPREPIEWVIVDHYALRDDWERAMRPYAPHIAVLDDLANRAHDCDVLIDQNEFPDLAHRYETLLPDQAKRLCGPRFALLRSEYACARELIGSKRGPPTRVLVFYGGSDVHNETGRAMRVLSKPAFQHLGVDVVIGANHPKRAEIVEQAQQRPGTTVYGPRDHLVDLMIKADVALGAGGTTTWERCTLGLPSIVTAVAENQIGLNRALHEKGAIDYLGYWSDVTDESLADALHRLVGNSERLAQYAQRAWYITDGLGRLRVAETLVPTPANALTLRPVRPVDKALLYEWANDPQTRHFAHNPELIPWADHEAWFDARLGDADTLFRIMTTPAGLPVGQARVDIEVERAVLNYSIDPVFRGRNWGTRLVELIASAWHELGINKRLVGTVFAGNEASCRAFRRAGFMEETSCTIRKEKTFYLPSGSTPQFGSR